MSKYILALGALALVLNTGEAFAHLRKVHHKPHHVHHKAQNTSRYPVLSYSVPPWGPYSGYQYYDDGYPLYLSSVRPYLGGRATVQPSAPNYPDYAYGCCGNAQKTVIAGNSGARTGLGASGPFGWNWEEP